MDTSGSPPPDRQGLEHTDTEEEETVELVDSHVPSTSTRAEQVCTYACIDVSMLRLTCMCMHVFEGRDENTCVCVCVCLTELNGRGRMGASWCFEQGTISICKSSHDRVCGRT